ncbi:MAG: pilus assembly protein [Pseudomonadales bacterium]|nr:pilus assembly protein [Pseudomonadales bacterium]MBO6597995.1 pilus assembly protein [Pseudomonadales bacterium]
MKLQKSRQQGVVLFMSLVMLLLLTALGASSIQTTSVQFQMAQSVDDINVAFQSAEAALRDAEESIEYSFIAGATQQMFTLTGPAGNSGIGDADLINTAIEFATLDWDDDNNSTAGTTVVDGASEPGRYIVEYIREVVGTEDRLNLTNIGEEVGAGGVSVYRVTARGKGFGTGRGEVFVQSTYGKVW